MRQLSQQLVAAQEEERRKLSRELHDHVGQMLTALRMELGRIERLRMPDNMPVSVAVDVNGSSVHNTAPKIWQAKIGKIPVQS